MNICLVVSEYNNRSVLLDACRRNTCVLFGPDAGLFPRILMASVIESVCVCVCVDSVLITRDHVTT